MKLEQLTPEQTELMHKFAQDQIAKALEYKELDPGRVDKLIEFLYSLIKKEKPKIIRLSSPLGLQLSANFLKRDQVWDQVWDQVRDQVRGQVWDQVRGQVSDQVWDQVSDQVSDQVWDQVRDQVRGQVIDQVRGQVSDQVWDQVSDQVWDQVRDQVRGQVWDQVRGQVSDQVWDQVSDQVRDQVWDQVWDQVRDQVAKIKYYLFSDVGFCDYGWLSFYEFFIKIGIISNNKFSEYYNLIINSNIYDCILFSGIALVCEKPCIINRDKQGRLHSINSSAIEWKDGYKLYFWHGLPIKEDWILHPERITVDQILKESNLELRRCLLEIYGTKNFFKDANAILINDGTKDPTSIKGVWQNNGKLFKIELGEDEPMVMLDVDNSTPEQDRTFRNYFLRVPPYMQTAKEARIWTMVPPLEPITEEDWELMVEA